MYTYIYIYIYKYTRHKPTNVRIVQIEHPESCMKSLRRRRPQSTRGVLHEPWLVESTYAISCNPLSSNFLWFVSPSTVLLCLNLKMVGFAFLESPPGIFTCPLMWACWCHMATCLALREGPYVGLEASGQFCLTRHFLEILGSVQAVAICARGRHAWPFPLKHMVLFQTGFKPLVTAARACVLVRRYVPSIQSCCWQIMLDARRFFEVFI